MTLAAVDGPDRLPIYCASRPVFEHLVRRCLADRDDVTLRGNCRVTEYLTDDGTTRIMGARAADLAVDATGRTSQMPVWLEACGSLDDSQTPAGDRGLAEDEVAGRVDFDRVAPEIRHPGVAVPFGQASAETIRRLSRR